MDPLAPSSFEPRLALTVGCLGLLWAGNLHLPAIAVWMDGVARGVAASLGIGL